MIDGQVFKAELDCTLSRPDLDRERPTRSWCRSHRARRDRSAGRSAAQLSAAWDDPERRALRRDPDRRRFEMVRVRSVPKQIPPYGSVGGDRPPASASCATSRGRWSGSASLTRLAGIELLGFHLHFACDQRLRGGHVLDYSMTDATVRIDEAAELHVELPAAVDPRIAARRSTSRRCDGWRAVRPLGMLCRLCAG